MTIKITKQALLDHLGQKSLVAQEFRSQTRWFLGRSALAIGLVAIPFICQLACHDLMSSKTLCLLAETSLPGLGALLIGNGIYSRIKREMLKQEKVNVKDHIDCEADYAQTFVELNDWVDLRRRLNGVLEEYSLPYLPEPTIKEKASVYTSINNRSSTSGFRRLSDVQDENEPFILAFTDEEVNSDDEFDITFDASEFARVKEGRAKQAPPFKNRFENREITSFSSRS